MKITRTEVWQENFKLKKPYTIASETFDSVENIFVRLETQDGSIGFGVASPAADVTGESAGGCLKALEKNLDQFVKGQDIRYLNGILRRLEDQISSTPSAIAAIDMALHDLFAKYLDLPLVDILGRIHDTLPTSVTIGINSVEESLEDAKYYLSQGFRILKVKIGRSVDEDMYRLVKIREQVGRDITIRVDANQGYSKEAFQRFMKGTEALGLEFIEQPLQVNDHDAMRSFSEIVRKKTAADESLLNVSDALRLAEEPHAFGIYNIKLMKCGGILPGLRIAEIAHTARIEVMWGCMDESIIGISAALHAALSSPATRYLDLDGSLELERNIVKYGFKLKDGLLSVCDRPGLGVVLI
jgi:L-alanine-DL-glutamate epimerase-like enolase superfamily enzyme